ncbi:homeodomain-containing [Trichoderma arundinaceum]|uniref:Homeodomain-containing n=1 Tax=Trichoderma arundinaceum TaxID=490622 RepID=A0A395NQ45_TRIAR|nr:homeodomain-containing [Trichoderma arundinaceum]
MTVIAQPAAFSRGSELSHDWDAPRPSEHFLPRADAKPFSLPSIRQMIPEIDMFPRDGGIKPQSNGNNISFMTPDYFASPNAKRRRLTDEAEEESSRARHVPRIYRGPRHRISHSPRLSTSSRSSERWATPTTTASPVTTLGAPTPVEVQEPSPISRVTLPSLTTTIKFENEAPGILESSMSRRQEPPRAYSHDYTHYHTQSHYQSQPSSPIRSYDRTPFSAGVYPPQHYQDPSHFGDLGSAAVGGGDTKQRKRRGNLPKETTDKLRTWFVAHLTHPYPTEDEKQELMRQTGLQMNQISNWFINARRRQLPAMIHARDSDALNGSRSASSREGKALASPPASDGEATSSDENIEILRHRRLGSMKRGSV